MLREIDGFELVLAPEDEQDEWGSRFNILRDGIEVPNSYVLKGEDSDLIEEITTQDEGLRELLKDMPLSTFFDTDNPSEAFLSIDFPGYLVLDSIRYMVSITDWHGDDDSIPDQLKPVSGPIWRTSFRASLGDESWPHEGFTIYEYFQRIRDVIDATPAMGVTSWLNVHSDSASLNIGLLSAGEKTARELIDHTAPSLIQAHEAAIEDLEKLDQNRVLAAFDFPEALQAPCSQYLLYFSQFLRDLGIDAKSELHEHAGKVLFSVTPASDAEALDKIREALQIYLHLPANPIMKSDDGFAIQRLEHQIEHLRFQVRMGESESRMLQREIMHQDELLKTAYAALSKPEGLGLKSVDAPDACPSEDTGKMFGLTKVKKTEDWGVQVDLAEIFKRLKKRFSGL